MIDFMQDPEEMLLSQDKEQKIKKDEPNSGDWHEQRDETDRPDGYTEGDENDNTGGAGSTGSAATNS